MTTVKRIVCLANSRKLNGRCVAGKELTKLGPGAWIRPVSAREHEEVSEGERRYENGSDPSVLDIIHIPLLAPRPKGFQQENWLLDPDRYWIRAGRVNWDDLAALVDPVEPLWVNGFHTYNGINDTIPLSQTGHIHDSLRLVHVTGMLIRVFKPGEAFGNSKRRVQGHFLHGSHEYQLWITDPVYERVLLARSDGDYNLGECALTISIGEPHNDMCYKLIAGIIECKKGFRL